MNYRALGLSFCMRALEPKDGTEWLYLVEGVRSYSADSLQAMGFRWQMLNVLLE